MTNIPPVRWPQKSFSVTSLGYSFFLEKNMSSGRFFPERDVVREAVLKVLLGPTCICEVFYI